MILLFFPAGRSSRKLERIYLLPKLSDYRGSPLRITQFRCYYLRRHLTPLRDKYYLLIRGQIKDLLEFHYYNIFGIRQEVFRMIAVTRFSMDIPDNPGSYPVINSCPPGFHD